ncbi:hypothetical protein BDV26DRAFT_262165 [Aspergillus bertholletiae]|uniref:Uncharacterized protein n=1 Tax=Aspergillus bertholletiae TaxID=1226010 RepID=A0A5N7B8T7_9EURO|nr:hypothetical protein BDV26DRAFT_262165 [Aspergillus bertholletiae]
MGLSKLAIVILVVVGCLAAVTLAAAIFGHINSRNESANPFAYSEDQYRYMRSVRLRNFERLEQESRRKGLSRMDCESTVYTENSSSRR